MLLSQQGSDHFGFMTTTIGSKYPSSYGIFGGYSPPTYSLCKIKDINVFDIMKNDPEKMAYTAKELMNERPFEDATYTTHHTGLQYELAQEGEIYIITQGAGGGYGDVLDRDPELVIKDIEEELISQETANEIYKVFYNPDTLVLDMDKTNKEREKERENRKKRGVPFDEFLKTWEKDEPPEHLPIYGSWKEEGIVYAGSPDEKMKSGELKGVWMQDQNEVKIAELEKEITKLKGE